MTAFAPKTSSDRRPRTVTAFELLHPHLPAPIAHGEEELHVEGVSQISEIPPRPLAHERVQAP